MIPVQSCQQVNKEPRILIFGYGNPGRQDDGLGVAIAERIEGWARQVSQTNIEVDSNYQLNIEDASNISEHDIVYFVDASKEGKPLFHMIGTGGKRQGAQTGHGHGQTGPCDLCAWES